MYDIFLSIGLFLENLEHQVLGEMLPRDHETTIRAVVADIDSALSAFIRGQGLVCLTLGTLYTVGLSLIGLKYGLLVGIFTGVMTFVPVVGSVSQNST